MNYYQSLNLSQLCSFEEVKATYKKLRLSITSDKKNTGDLANSKLAEIDEAYETLIDPDLRREYDIWLENNGGEDGKLYEVKSSTFDFAKYRKSSKSKWSDLINSSNLGDPYAVLSELLDQVLYLPDSEIQKPFIIASILTPSALSETLPLLFCYGHEGTGKSLIGKIAARLWGITPLGATTTYVGIRNKINKHRWIEREGRRIEQNFLLVWNDIKPENLRDKNLISLLKCGYDRGESLIEISSTEKDGTNQTFDVFSMKIFSSISPIFSYPEYAEITRRMLICYCQKASTDLDLVPITDIDFKDFSSVASDYWCNDQVCEKYASIDIRKAFRKTETSIDVDRIDIAANVLKTGITLGIWDSPQSAINAFAIYEEYQQNLKDNHGDLTKLTLKTFLESKIDAGRKKVEPIEIKNYLLGCSKAGIIEENPKQSEINKLMKSLGWKYSQQFNWWFK